MKSPNNIVNMQHATQASTSAIGKGNANTNNSSPKMGSRRIFTPQFKLQVLESYRNDNDCKGNQRATARKYNIHRRQIQKWLQCESNLRSSVANINHNSVKHQFHNVSMQQQSKNVSITAYCSGSGSSYTPDQLYPTRLCLDSPRESVNTIKVPSLSVCENTSSIQGTHDVVFDAENLTVGVAPTFKGNTDISKSSDIVQAVSSVGISSLPTSAIIRANITSNTSMSPFLHHHNFGIPPYSSNISSNATTPILAHTHLSNQQSHIRQQNHIHNQISYQYLHNMGYSSNISHNHHQTEKQQQLYFTPVINLPITTLSTATSNSINYTREDNEIAEKTYMQFASDPPYYESNDSIAAVNTSNINIPFSINQFKQDLPYSMVYPFVPIDLSIRHRREVQSSEIVNNVKTICQNVGINHMGNPTKKECNGEKIDVVDLTYRKRRIGDIPNPSNDGKMKSDISKKYSKLSNEDVATSTPVSHLTINSSNSTDDDDIEIEVGIEEKFSAPSSKPIKLFKPYLLDEGDCKLNDDEPSKELLEMRCLSNNQSSNDISTRDTTFPDIVKEMSNSTCIGSLNFLVESRCESPRSSCSPATSLPTISPTNYQFPKGSPASSGYESSTSTYSDSSSLSSKHEIYTYGQTYKLNLQMDTIYNENTNILHPSKHVQRWLEKDESKLLTTNSSIALLV